MKYFSNALVFIFWTSLTVGGAAYVVFELHRSAWWMLLGILLAMSLKITEKK